MEQKSLALIDANSIVNRAFYAMTYLTTEDGTPIGAVYGFTVMLLSLLDKYKPSQIVAAFDMKAPTFRHKMYDGYKANRHGMPDDLAVQLPLLKELLKACGIAVVECEGYEADDIIGTLAKRSEDKVYVLTGDRDSFQLVSEKTTVLMTRKGLSEIEEVTPEHLKEAYSLTPAQVVDYKAIAGDQSDCIPGVRGIGDKGAISLLNQFGTLNNIYDRLDEIKGATRAKLEESKDNAFLSYELATINTNAPIGEVSEKLKFPFDGEVKRIFARYKFNSLLKRNELFASEVEAEEVEQTAPLKVIEVTAETLPEPGKKIAACIIDGKFKFAFNKNEEYVIDLSECGAALKKYKKLFEDIPVVYSLKSMFNALDGLKEFYVFEAFDVYIALYLLEMRHEVTGAAELFDLKDRLEREIQSRDMNKLFYDIELPLIRVLYDMEKRGFHIDRAAVEKLLEEYKQKEEESANKICALAGKQFNVNSPKQLAKVLFEDLKLPYRGKMPYSTGKEVLETLVGEPIIDEIIEYRFISKMRSAFLDGMIKAVREDGTVHTHFNQTVTTTGRLSSTDPNLQNIPVRSEQGKYLRSMFVAKDGYMLVDADYSQIELKLLAHFSGEKKLIKAFNDGEDIHAVAASDIFNVPITMVTPDLRRAAKAVNFGTIYGISAFGLSRNIHMSPSSAKEYITMYYEKYPAVKEYLDGLISAAKKCGYATTMFNRRRKIPELVSAKYSERAFGERVARNMPLQGTAADIIKIAMVEVSKRLKDLDAALVLQIHDELIVEAREDLVPQVKQILKDCMENAASLSVPLNVDIAAGKTWLDCK